MKEKFQYNWIGNILLFLLAAICVFFVVQKSNQASLSKLLRQTITGEYSRDEDEVEFRLHNPHTMATAAHTGIF